MNRRTILTSAAGAAAGAILANNLVAAADADTRHEDVGGPPRVVFIVSIHVKPGFEGEFLRLVASVLDAMRHETAFVNAVLHRDPEDATRFMLYETWADLDDVLKVQIHREYRRAYLARLPEMLRDSRQFQVWQPVRGDFTFFAGTQSPGLAKP